MLLATEQSTETAWPAKPEVQTEERPWRQRHSKGRGRRWSKRKRLPRAKYFARHEIGRSDYFEMPAATRALREEPMGDKRQPRLPVPREEAASSTIRKPDRMPRSPASRFRNAGKSRYPAPDSLDRSLNHSREYLLN